MSGAAGRSTGARHDLYRPIHKALRVALFDTARRLGGLDADDPRDLAQTLGQTERLLALLAGHLRHEDDFLHTAIEARHPGGAQRSADDHREHLDSLGALADEVAALRRAPAAERDRLAGRLYQQLNRFVAENLEHMQFEETHNSAALWALYSDDELGALHERLVASIAPHELTEVLLWMARALNTAELAGLFHGMRAKAPPAAYGAALAAARAQLDETRWARLARALGPAAAPVAATGPHCIHGLHHNAWRCSDSARTRRFYEDFLGLPLAAAIRLEQTQTGRAESALHSFFQLGDGSFLAFFEVPGMPFAFKPQHDFDLHIALEVDADALAPTMDRARREGIEVRGVADHGFIDSIYLRDPDGYVVELCARRGDAAALDSAEARRVLARWQAERSAATAA